MKGISDDGGREINGNLPFSCGGDGKGILGELSGTFTFTPETPLDGETELTFNFKITDADGDEQTVSVIYAVGSGPDKPDPVVPDMGALDVTVDEAGFSGGSELDDAIKALQRDKDRRGKELEAETRSVEAARENLQRHPNDLPGQP